MALKTGERIFGREHATKKANSVSLLNDFTTFEPSQLSTKVKILPTHAIGKQGRKTSLLEVINGKLGLKEIHIPQSGNEATVVRAIDSIAKVTFIYEPTGLPGQPVKYTIPDAIDINSTGTKVCVEQREMRPISVNVDFSDIVSDPVWNGEPMNIIYVHACVDIIPKYYLGMTIPDDLAAFDFGGGMFYNLFEIGSAATPTDWQPLLCGTKISSRTIGIPMTFAQTSLKLMFRGCKSWSLEFLTYITGV